MPLHEVWYPSGPWWVKGYLAWPDDYPLARPFRDVWRESVVAVCGGASRLECEPRVTVLPGTLEAWAGEYAIPAAVRPVGRAAYDSSHLHRGAHHSPPAHALGPVYLRTTRAGGAASGDGVALPAVVFCRGGIGRVGAVRKHWLAHWAQTQRCIVFAPCYRGNEGSEGRDEFGGSDVEDVQTAVRVLRALPFVVLEEVYLVGFSRGAINALAAVARWTTDPAAGAVPSGAGCSPVIAPVAGVAVWGGVADLALTYQERIDLRRMLRRVIGGPPWRVPERYEARSAVCWAGALRVPVVIVHGTADVQVSVRHAHLLAEALRSVGRPAWDICLLEGAGHHLSPLVHDAVVTWIMEKLRQARRVLGN